MKSIPIYIVDSFTDEIFKGNPAGVCFPASPLNEEVMQSIAKELNLSETAFITKADSHYKVRYFSPIKEIPLCGHATLASAKILFELEQMNQIHFITGLGDDLHVECNKEKISMEFPKYTTIKSEASAALLNALGIKEIEEARFNSDNNILMLVISEDSLETLAPDFNALIKSNDLINGVLVTAKSNSEYDFKSRYFWPWSGGSEDPVTGATHTFMAPYWTDKLKKKKLKSFQASQRTGSMDVEVKDDKIEIMGKAVIVVKGTLTI